MLRIINFFQPGSLKLVIALLGGVFIWLLAYLAFRRTIFQCNILAAVITSILLLGLDWVLNRGHIAGMNHLEHVDLGVSLIRALGVGILITLQATVLEIAKFVGMFFWR